MLLRELIHQADAKKREADEAIAQVTRYMHAAVERLLPAETVIDLREQQTEHLMRVKTMAGKDHGTRIFRIVRVTGVQFSPAHPELARWEANAIPVSEKTGKDLDGSVAHAVSNRGKAVRLVGDLSVSHGPDEPFEVQLGRLIQLIDSAMDDPPEFLIERVGTSQAVIDSCSDSAASAR